jgi:hypothetical protein
MIENSMQLSSEFPRSETLLKILLNASSSQNLKTKQWKILSHLLAFPLVEKGLQLLTRVKLFISLFSHLSRFLLSLLLASRKFD